MLLLGVLLLPLLQLLRVLLFGVLLQLVQLLRAAASRRSTLAEEELELMCRCAGRSDGKLSQPELSKLFDDPQLSASEVGTHFSSIPGCPIVHLTSEQPPTPPPRAPGVEEVRGSRGSRGSRGTITNTGGGGGQRQQPGWESAAADGLLAL